MIAEYRRDNVQLNILKIMPSVCTLLCLDIIRLSVVGSSLPPAVLALLPPQSGTHPFWHSCVFVITYIPSSS